MFKKRLVIKNKRNDNMDVETSDFALENLNMFDKTLYYRLKEPVKKLIYGNKIKQIVRKFSNVNKRKSKPTYVQNIINNMFKSKDKIKGLNLEEYFKRNNITKEEYNFFSEISNMRTYNKKITLPKTLCIKPVEIYYYFDEEIYTSKSLRNIGSYFTNDLLYWAFKFEKFLVEHYRLHKLNDLIDSCIIMKKVSIISKNFRLNEGEVISGYLQDDNKDISYVGYKTAPEDVSNILLTDVGDEVLHEDSMTLNDIQYVIRYVDEFILIYKKGMELDSVSATVEKENVLYKKDNEMYYGLKANSIKNGYYYLEILNVKLTNFAPSVLYFLPEIQIPYSYFIVCEVDLSKFFDVLYKLHFSEIVKDEDDDEMKDRRSKGIKDTTDDSTYLNDMEKIPENFKKKEKLEEVKKGKKQRDEYIEKMKVEEEKDYPIQEDESFNARDYYKINDIKEKDMVTLESDFIFWDNIPSCFEFIGVLSYVGGIKARKVRFLRYIYIRYNQLKDVFSIWIKCYNIFRKIVKNFYDSCSNKLGYDKLMRIKEKSKKFLDMYNVLKNNSTYKELDEYIKDISIYAAMIGRFVCKNNAYNIVNLISNFLNELSILKSENLEKKVRSIGALCLSVFFNGEECMIPEIRSPAAFLGNLKGELSSYQLVDFVNELIKKSKNEKEIKKDEIREQVNNFKRVNEEMRKRVINYVGNRNIKDKEKFLNYIFGKDNIREILINQQIADMLKPGYSENSQLKNKILIDLVKHQVDLDKLNETRNKIISQENRINNQINNLENQINVRANVTTQGVDNKLQNEIELFQHNPKKFDEYMRNKIKTAINKDYGTAMITADEFFIGDAITELLYSYQLDPSEIYNEYIIEYGNDDKRDSEDNLIMFATNRISGYIQNLFTNDSFSEISVNVNPLGNV